MNNKAEGKASTMVYAIILIVGVMMTFTTLTIHMAKSYEVDSIEEFDYYDDLYSDFSTDLDQFVDTAEYTEEEAVDTGGGIYNAFKSWVAPIKESVNNWWQQSMLRSAYVTISGFPKLFKFTVRFTQGAVSNTGLFIPDALKYTIISLITVTAIILVVRVKWGAHT